MNFWIPNLMIGQTDGRTGGGRTDSGDLLKGFLRVRNTKKGGKELIDEMVIIFLLGFIN